MVEGPGATKNADKARTLVGLKCDAVGGDAAHLVAPNAYGATLIEVLSLGKQVFLFFRKSRPPPPPAQADVIDLCSDEEQDVSDDGCVRLHFGMSGSLRVDGISAAPSRQRRVLGLRFDASRTLDVFCDKDTGCCRVVSAAAARKSFAEMRTLDVCYDGFDAARAATKVQAALLSKLKTIAAVLLDQDVLPGSGNIIKNEALHSSRVRPDATALTAAEAARLVNEVRSYSEAWFKRSRPACFVYNLQACGSCGGPVAVLKDGTTANRVTFSCAQCCKAGWSETLPAKPKPKKRPREAPRAVLLKNHTCKAPSEKVVRVQKDKPNESNKGRLFWGCRRRGCGAFAWADDHFPQCKCPSKAGLKLCKQGDNAGRWFLGCRKPQGQGCNSFAWAAPDLLEPLGDLKPLL
ncbi:hypothetical protein M885DRAFT_537527 [Pelagophyceae sp. CCMP2097]|nr:hypothetical protein M885DRAFT_537527 [Pelagophyceae sp. CCMP2097]|mmetsp:Transcript_25187/g.86306  ORF Transcript_25187/g.86306 Transcript_25187/m.86306 type:complete len:406 (+) Transcript_25187:128-1345(+)